MDIKSFDTNQAQFSDNSTNPAEEFLKTEYGRLSEWAVHSEDVTHQIFNFYVTLLTAVLGGLLFALQLLSNVQSFLIIAAGACGFLLLIGVVFFDGLVDQYIRSAYYHAAMRSIRSHFRHYPEVDASLVERPMVFSKTSAPLLKSISHRLVFVTIGFPGGNQLTLIEFTNSLLVGALVLCFIWGIAGIGFRAVETVIAAIACVIISLVAHRILSNLVMRRNLSQLDKVLIPITRGEAKSPTVASTQSAEVLLKPDSARKDDKVS